MKVLAIDFGTKRIGVAISEGTLAEPLVVLENDQNIFHQLQEIIDKYKIERLVIGLSENEMADQTRDFAQELEAVIDVPFEFFDAFLILAKKGRNNSEIMLTNQIILVKGFFSRYNTGV